MDFEPVSPVFYQFADRKKLPDPKVFQQQGVELGVYAMECGASGVVYTVPDMIRPEGDETEAELTLRYFEKMSAAVDAPIFIYQPPGVDDKYQMSPELIAKLAEIPNVVAAKVSTNDAEYLFNLNWALRDKEFTLIAGAETAYYAALYAGVRAVIGQGCTLNPQIIKEMQAAIAREFAAQSEVPKTVPQKIADLLRELHRRLREASQKTLGSTEPTRTGEGAASPMRGRSGIER